jgi:hypothetical protein
MMDQLFLLKTKKWQGYDTFTGFVICATSEADARRIADENSADEGRGFWTDPEQASCEVISYTTCYAGNNPIVLEAFHAG